MTLFTCNTLRATILLAGGLLALAILLLLPVILLPKPLPYAVTLLVYPGFATLIMSPLVLVAVGIISALPSVNAQLHNCQH